MAITLPITSRAASDDNDFADVYGNDAQLVSELDARDSVYRTIFSSNGVLSNDVTASTFLMGTVNNGVSVGTMTSSAGGFAPGITPLHLFYFDDADYSVSSKTTKLRVRAQMAANATSLVASGITTKIGLYPVTVAGGSDFLIYTAGTLVSGSEVNVGVAASTIAQGNSGDFTIPSDGAYCFCLVTNVTLPNNSAISAHAQLQVRWV